MLALGSPLDDASPIVIVELPADAQSHPNVKTLLKACTVALRRGECIPSSPDGEAPGRSTEAIAVVTFVTSDRLQVLVEVGTQREGRPTWTSRQIVFRPEDSEAERWRSMGFTIASLVGALGIPEGSSTEPADTTPAPRAQPLAPAKIVEPPKREPRPPKPTQPGHFHAGARFETGPGLDNGAFGFGGAVLLGYDLPGGVLAASALAASAARPGAVSDVDMTWTRFGVGLTVAARLPLDLEGRGALLVALERIAATEKDGASLAEETQSRWLSGVEVDVGARWPRTSPVGGLLGGYLVRLAGGTAVKSHGTVLASSPASEIGLFVGVEVRP